MKSILTRAIPIVFYAALIIFLGLYISRIDWSTLQAIDLNIGLLILATVLSLAFRYWGVTIWLFLLKRLGAPSLRGQYAILALVYAKSWLGRYIPGAATWILGKIYFASRLGISRGRLAVSGLLEGGIQIVTTLAAALLLLLLDPRTASLPMWMRLGVIAIFAVCVVALVPPVFAFMVNLALAVFRRPRLSPELRPSAATISWTAVLYLLGTVLAGGSYFLIAAALYPGIKGSDALFIIGASSLASAISMLAIFAPSGLGVREGVLGLLLAIVVPGEIALVIVVVSRLWSVAVDLLFLAVAVIVERVRRHPRNTMAVEG